MSDLDKNEQNILMEFRSNVQDTLKPNHNDAFLLRWLRARNYDLCQAEAMLREDVKFRRLFGADSILEWYELRKEIKPYLFTTFLGFDNEGHPVRLVNFRNLDLRGGVYSSTLRELEDYLVYALELDLKRLDEKNKKLGRHVEKSTIIADNLNFQLLNFSDKKVIQTLYSMAQLYLNHYPERLHRLYIINVPQLYAFTFEIFKPLFPENVWKKIKIYGKTNWQEELFSNIPKEVLPKFMGGSRYHENDDVYCNDIRIENEKVPQSLYLPVLPPMTEGDPSVQLVTLAPRSISRTSREVTTLGMFICWRFQLKAYDMHFSLVFTPTKETRELKLDIDIITRDKIKSNEFGRCMCEEYGTFTFIFDNSSSIMTSKNLLYKIEMVPPTSINSFK